MRIVGGPGEPLFSELVCIYTSWVPGIYFHVTWHALQAYGYSAMSAVKGLRSSQDVGYYRRRGCFGDQRRLEAHQCSLGVGENGCWFATIA